MINYNWVVTGSFRVENPKVDRDLLRAIAQTDLINARVATGLKRKLNCSVSVYDQLLGPQDASTVERNGTNTTPNRV